MPTQPARRTPDTPTTPNDFDRLDVADDALQDEVRIEEAELHGHARPGLDARGITVSESRITAALTGAILRDAHFRDCVFHTADLANADLRGAAFHRCTITDARLTGAALPETSLQDVTFTGCRLDLMTLADARIERVELVDCTLTETAFDGAQIRDVKFERCELAGTSFPRAQIARTHIFGCDLTRVRGIADLRGATMRWPDVVDNAAAFAAAAGIRILVEDD